MKRWWCPNRWLCSFRSAPVTFSRKDGGTGVISQREYHRRARSARQQMTQEQAAAFELIVVDRLTLQQAARLLNLPEDEVVRRSVAAFRTHVDVIEAPARRWWRRW